MVQKKDLKEYLNSTAKKPSAEVKFKTTNEDNVTEISVASETYVENHLEDELQSVAENEELSERMEKALIDRELDEMVESFDTVDEPSPLTQNPNNEDLSETAILIQLVSTLIDKVDNMQNFSPVIHVPAPIINVTLPETKRTVTKAIERDENNFISTIKESVQEEPLTDPLIEITQDKDKE